LGARTVAQQALDWSRRHLIVPWVISDRAAVDACLRFADDHVLVEPAAAAGRRIFPRPGDCRPRSDHYHRLRRCGSDTRTAAEVG
jgi:L-serine/L-threonine ammonia-lyase